ncbi:MAG: glutamate--cysteine ligase [Gammaproteobacteria bacterium]|nr:glutamate--cysteine ligase [Gammaproteobacteria bacterium]
MGDEISVSRFTKKDYDRFHRALSQETELLLKWIEKGSLSEIRAVGGFEQEIWLTQKNFLPAPENEALLNRLNDPYVTPELAKFNIELNVDPEPLQGNSLSVLHSRLQENWERTQKAAQAMDLNLMITGILPTLRDEDITIQNMSSMNRYHALNEQVMHARKGKPLVLDIVGQAHLKSEHSDVMLESAATSFQVHRQIDQHRAAAYYNAAIICSAPSVAVAANSPYFFGVDLWEETRIPLFEQAVEVGGYGSASQGPVRRVSFGTGYVKHHLGECFKENLEHFPVLLPVTFDTPQDELRYLRLHNGTIWRWNRPLLGFDEDGTPHFRIEHRVIAAGPSLIDELANAAFFLGLQEALATQEKPPEKMLDFSDAKSNFYSAARKGIHASVVDFDGKRVSLKQWLLTQLIPFAIRGLESLKIDRDEIEHYMEIIKARVSTERTGAHWQRQFVKSNGPDMHALAERYYQNQCAGKPVHEWER